MTNPFKRLECRYRYFRVRETGWPKTDYLLQYHPRKSWKATHGIEKPVILYAPTFSPSLSSASALRPTIEKLAAKGNFHWLVKFHPLMDERIVGLYRNMQIPNLQIVDDADIIPYMHAADVMVSDTSSVVAEFLMLNKPVVTYRTKSAADHILNFRRPGDLAVSLEQALSGPKKVMSAAEIYIKQMHPYTDGRSSERVLAATDSFIEKYQGRLNPKPLNLYRRLRIRQRMKYYRWK